MRANQQLTCISWHRHCPRAVLDWPYLAPLPLAELHSGLRVELPCHFQMYPTQRLDPWGLDRGRDQGRIWRGESYWHGEEAYSGGGDLPWDLDSNYLRASEGGVERSRNVEEAGQPCQAGGGKPAELDILKP